jgi:hypothetical protein
VILSLRIQKFTLLNSVSMVTLRTSLGITLRGRSSWKGGFKLFITFFSTYLKGNIF